MGKIIRLLFFGILLFISGPILREDLFAQVPSNFDDIVISDKCNFVTGLTYDSSGTIYLTEKAGKVKIIKNNVLLSKPLLDITEEVGNWGEHGLLGIVLHPDFLQNGYFYIFYTVDRHHLIYYGQQSYSSTINSFFEATINRVTRYQADVVYGYTKIVPGSRLILIGESKYSGIPVLSGNHDGGALLFGEDKSLLVFTGDASTGGAIADTGSLAGTYYAQALADSIITIKENVGAFRAQLPDNLNGKILRINPGNGKGMMGNPFYNSANPGSALSRLWALGLRNPFKASLIKGTGNPNLFYKDPGTIILHDVGAGKREEINFCDILGQNFGWPIFEGISSNVQFASRICYNLDAPNPLSAQVANCPAYFMFSNLLINETLGTLSWPNPCNKSIQIPTTLKRFKHKRPLLDYSHKIPEVRIPSFNGPFPIYKYLGDTSLTIQGFPFSGKCNSGGALIIDESLGPEYKNCLLQCDYNDGWIRTFKFSPYYQLLSVDTFASNLGNIHSLVYSNKDSSIYYVKYPNELHRIRRHKQNLAPTAIIETSVSYGTAPLTVYLNASNSTDPEGDPLIYKWYFNNGGKKSGVTVSHTFYTPNNQPKNGWVKLVVTDPFGNKDSTTSLIFLNNFPPAIDITSVTDSGYYPTDITSYLPLVATVSDDKTPEPDLKFAWKVNLHHDEHIHPNLTDTAHTTYTYVGPEGCNEPYYYSITLDVTDAMKLTNSQTKILLPDCSARIGNHQLMEQPYLENHNIKAKSILLVSPNPADNKMTIHTTPLSIIDDISVSNIYGKKVDVPFDRKKADTNKYLINVEHLDAGVYFLTIISEWGIMTTRFIKK